MQREREKTRESLKSIIEEDLAVRGRTRTDIISEEKKRIEESQGLEIDQIREKESDLIQESIEKTEKERIIKELTII